MVAKLVDSEAEPSPATASPPASPSEPPKRPERPERPNVDRKARLLLEPKLPAKQPAEVRRGNWDEVFHLFDPETAKAEATRCIQCPAAPCLVACPVGNDIPASFWLLEQGDFDGAANVFRETSELPEMPADGSAPRSGSARAIASSARRASRSPSASSRRS